MKPAVNPFIEPMLDARLAMEKNRLSSRYEMTSDEVLRRSVQSVRNWAVVQGFGVSGVDAWTDRVCPDYRRVPLAGSDFSTLEAPFPAGVSSDDLALAELVAGQGLRISPSYSTAEFSSWCNVAAAANLELSRRTGWVGDRPMRLHGSKGVYFSVGDGRIDVWRAGSVWGTVCPDRGSSGISVSGFAGVLEGYEKETVVNTVLSDANVQFVKGETYGCEVYRTMEYGSRVFVFADGPDAALSQAFSEYFGSVEFLPRKACDDILKAYYKSVSHEGESVSTSPVITPYVYTGAAVMKAEERMMGVDYRRNAVKADAASRASLEEGLSALHDEFCGKVGAARGSVLVCRGAATLFRRPEDGLWSFVTLKGRNLMEGGRLEPAFGQVRYRVSDPDSPTGATSKARFASADKAVEWIREYLFSDKNVAAAKASLARGRKEKEAVSVRPVKKGRKI